MRIPHVKLSSPFHLLAALWRALVNRLRGRKVVADKVLQWQRQVSCYSCVEYDPETTQCVVCSCFVPLKVMLTSEKCPLGRW